MLAGGGFRVLEASVPLKLPDVRAGSEVSEAKRASTKSDKKVGDHDQSGRPVACTLDLPCLAHLALQEQHWS